MNSEPTALLREPAAETVEIAQEGGGSPDDAAGRIERIPHVLRHPLRAAWWVVTTLLGMFWLWVLLAVVAAIPIVNFLTLGYLLEAEGRVARTGKLRDGFPLLRQARRVGTVIFWTWLWVLPIWWLSSAASDAALIDAGGRAARVLGVVRPTLAILVAVHLCLALARGGTVGCFLRPLKNVRWCWTRWRRGELLGIVGDASDAFVARLRLRHHFVLGVEGFVGLLLWLLVPTALLAMLRETGRPLQVIAAALGGALLTVVLAWGPFLQARFAAERRWGALFEWRAVRTLFTHAPLAWLVTVVAVYVLSLPLYLLKIALPPDDAKWLVNLVFLAGIFPARLLTGWAYHRATARDVPRRRGWKWFGRVVLVPLLAVYVFFVFLTPLIDEHGRWVLFEHHALLLPAFSW
jgi:hypothetical protein